MMLVNVSTASDNVDASVPDENGKLADSTRFETEAELPNDVSV